MSNSTLSATSHEERREAAVTAQREDLVDGHSPQEEEELDEMEVEYIEVTFKTSHLKECCHLSVFIWLFPLNERQFSVVLLLKS